MTIDGSQKSGSGTIVRCAVALAALLREPVRVVNVRTKRRSPGLRPQHVTSILACAGLCGAVTEGVATGSREFSFAPGPTIAGGSYDWDIGTAGSTTMLAFSVLPLACFADAPVRARIEGGVFQDFVPSPHHLQHVLGPLLERMGVAVTLEVTRPGYVPGGAGVVHLTVTPADCGLAALTLTTSGSLGEVRGIALSSHLVARQVSDRMALVCEERLTAAGCSSRIERIYDMAALHAGANLSIWAESDTGCRFGADRAGRLGRSSESIGQTVAAEFLEDTGSGATVDRHLADQLVVFTTLARGTSRYRIPRATEHLDSNLWLVGQFGAHAGVEDKEVVIDGLAR